MPIPLVGLRGNGDEVEPEISEVVDSDDADESDEGKICSGAQSTSAPNGGVS